MKRVRVAPGKFVAISAELAERAARLFATGLTREQVQHLKAADKERVTLMVGSPKPLAIAKRTASTRPKAAATPAGEVATSRASRPKTS